MRYVLVHGSWHDGSAFGEVARHLRDQGNEVHTPTIAGHGKNVSKDVSHADCVASISDYVKTHDLRDVVLLGHSYGGSVISKAVEFISDRVKRLIFYNAFVLKSGDRMLDATPYKEMFTALAAASSDNSIMIPFNVWRESFINDADLDLAKSCYEKLSSEPFRQLTDTIDLTKFYELVQSGKLPCSYINATEDNVLPQGPEWGWHPRMSNRLGAFRLVQLPGSHEVLFSNPAALANAIIQAGRD